jgi:4'-phosphopantetheinyl transferase
MMASWEIGRDEVHVWRASLDRAESSQELERCLNAVERTRAARFCQARDRRRFIAAHAVLRRLLAAYCRCDPLALHFAAGPWGKPFLAVPAADLCFNLSHSGELAVYALTRGADIGIDIEYRRAELASDEIATRFFAPEEVAALRALPPRDRTAAFFRCWTRKEAFIKARGEGLSLLLHRFAVSLAPEPRAALLSIDGSEAAAAEWSVSELPAPEGYTAALAVRARGRRLTIRDWDHDTREEIGAQSPP